MMFVDNGLLHSGALAARRAGEHAHHAAEQLSQGSLVAEMFGDFAAAQAFHQAAGSVRAQHLQLLMAHRDALDTLGTKGHLAAATFTQMEQGNAADVRAVRCGSVT